MNSSPTLPNERNGEDSRARPAVSREEFEEFRRQASRDETRLHKAILRLAISHAGASTEFDHELLNLRTLLRQHGSEQSRRSAIENVLTALTTVTARRGTGATARAGAQLQALLDQVHVPAARSFELRQLRTRLDSADAGTADAALQGIATILNECFGSDDSLVELLGRLRLKGDAGIALIEIRQRLARASADSERLQVIDALVELLERSAEARRGKLDVEALTMPEVSSVLHQLLDWMCLPSTANAKVAEIRAHLTDALSEVELTAVLKDIAGLVASLRSDLESELAALEDFLQSLTARVTTLDAALQRATGVHADTLADATRLQQSMAQEIDTLRETAQRLDNVEVLRGFLDERFASIGRSLDAFQNRQSGRHAQAEDNGRALEQELAALRAQTESLKGALATERERALIDGLTGIANRRALEQRLSEEIERARRYGATLTVALFDLDHFKRVNDTYGHQAGDRVLAAIAELVRDRMRSADFCARYGGEEFVILLPETGLDGARIALDQLRAEVERCRFHHRGVAVPVTISAGVALCRPDDGNQSVLDRADRALYACKAGGRNRVIDERELDSD